MMDAPIYPCEIIRECIEYPYTLNPPIEVRMMTIDEYYELLEEAYHNAAELLKKDLEDGTPKVERVWCGSKIRNKGELMLLKVNIGGVWWRDKKSAPNRISREEERYLSPTQSRKNGRGKEREKK